MAPMVPGKRISLQEAALDILRIEHQRYKAVLYYVSQWEKGPETLSYKLQLSTRESNINTAKELRLYFAWCSTSIQASSNSREICGEACSTVRVYMNGYLWKDMEFLNQHYCLSISHWLLASTTSPYKMDNRIMSLNTQALTRLLLFLMSITPYMKMQIQIM